MISFSGPPFSFDEVRRRIAGELTPTLSNTSVICVFFFLSLSGFFPPANIVLGSYVCFVLDVSFQVHKVGKLNFQKPCACLYFCFRITT